MWVLTSALEVSSATQIGVRRDREVVGGDLERQPQSVAAVGGVDERDADLAVVWSVSSMRTSETPATDPSGAIAEGGVHVAADVDLALLGGPHPLGGPLGVLEVELAERDLGDQHPEQPAERREVLLGADGVEGDDPVVVGGVAQRGPTSSRRAT